MDDLLALFAKILKFKEKNQLETSPKRLKSLIKERYFDAIGAHLHFPAVPATHSTKGFRAKTH